MVRDPLQGAVRYARRMAVPAHITLHEGDIVVVQCENREPVGFKSMIVSAGIVPSYWMPANAYEFTPAVRGKSSRHFKLEQVNINQRKAKFKATVASMQIDGLDWGKRDGFGLIEALIAMGLTLAIVGVLATMLMSTTRAMGMMVLAEQHRAQANGRLQRSLINPTTPEAGVTVTVDATADPCFLYHLTTDDGTGRTLEAWATRGCAAR